jgi:hypothetical protein
MTQLVVVIEIFVAERDPKHSLTNQRLHRVLNQLRPSLLAKHAANRLIRSHDRSSPPK